MVNFNIDTANGQKTLDGFKILSWCFSGSILKNRQYRDFLKEYTDLFAEGVDSVYFLKGLGPEGNKENQLLKQINCIFLKTVTILSLL